MPLSEHEQRILEQMERELAQQDPRFVRQVSKGSLYTHAARRVRGSVAGFFAGLVMLFLFFVSIWLALAGFAVMLLSGLVIYHYLKRIGRDQLALARSRSSLAASLVRFTRRFRRHPPAN